MLESDDKPRLIPEKFRASLDPNDPAGFELLQRNDEMQAQLSARMNSPFTGKSPRDLFRTKAHITISTLTNPALVLTDEMKEQLAERYAMVGRYDLASETSVAHKELYEQYWDAIMNGAMCEHSGKNLSEYVWSIAKAQEVALYKCGACGGLSV